MHKDIRHLINLSILLKRSEKPHNFSKSQHNLCYDLIFILAHGLIPHTMKQKGSTIDTVVSVSLRKEKK